MNEPEPEDRLSHLFRCDPELVNEVGATLRGTTLVVVRTCRGPGADELRGHMPATDVSRQLPCETNDRRGEHQQPFGDVSTATKARCRFNFPVPCSLFPVPPCLTFGPRALRLRTIAVANARGLRFV